MTDKIGTDQNYLLNDQYRNASNLNARIALHERFSTNPYSFQRWVFDHLQISPNSKILELGCGPGSLWVKNAERIPDSWHITLSDFSAGMLQEAQHNLQSVPHPFDFQQADAQNIPFADATFDAVIANHMLYHVPDRAKAIAEVRRVLKPEGRFYAATNGEAHLRELDMLVQRVLSIDMVQDGGWDSFTLEHGAEELSRQFTHIELFVMYNNLVVTEVEPIIAFIRSTRTNLVLTDEHRERMREIVAQEIAEHGSFFITKSTGLFEAYGSMRKG